MSDQAITPEGGSMAGSSGTPHAYFTRRATGLVRDIRVRDAVIFNVLPACPGIIMAVSVFWILSTLSGVNLYVAMLIAAACAFVISGAFGMLSQIMPRSGADYILISRSLHPALGIGSSILIGASSMLSIGYWGIFSCTVCIGPMLTMIGVAAKSSTLQQWGTSVTQAPTDLIIGFVECAILIAIMMYGTRLLMRVQAWLFALGMLGLGIAAVILLTTSRETFIAAYNAYATPYTHQPDTYHYFLTRAQASGITTGGGTNWGNTIIGSGAIIAFGVWSWYSANFAGEVRQAGTNRNWYSMLGGLVITYGSIMIMTALLYNTVGREFLTAVNGISSNAKVYTLPVSPWWITLVAAIHNNVVLTIILAITFIAWAPLITFIQFIQPVRALFAWSFDRVIPGVVASINERTHTPVFMLGLILVASIPFLYAAAYASGFFVLIALASIVGFPTFFLVGLSAIVFPYRKRTAYEASSANISLFGLPVMVYFGVAAMVAAAFGAWLFLVNPQLGLPSAGKSIWAQLFTSPGNGGLALVACCLIAGGLIYYVARAWRSREGIDIALNYMEIPPE